MPNKIFKIDKSWISKDRFSFPGFGPARRRPHPNEWSISGVIQHSFDWHSTYGKHGKVGVNESRRQLETMGVVSEIADRGERKHVAALVNAAHNGERYLHD